MKKLLSLEEFAQLVLCSCVLFQMPYHLSVYWLIALFFLPDVFAVGFLINNTIGTIMYNISHHKLVAIATIAIGYFTITPTLLELGIVVYAHSCFDRMIGYGLKLLGNANKTHLGFIGKEKHKNLPDTF